MRKKHAAVLVLTLGASLLAGCCAGEKKIVVPDIVIAPDASRLEQIAAAEVRRYLYLATGGIPAVVKAASLSNLANSSIVVSRKGLLLLRDLEAGIPFEQVSFENVPKLAPEDYWLKTIARSGLRHLLVAGGDGPGILYGAYAFAEQLGVRFELDGDVVPEFQVTFAIPDLDKTGRPLFAIRGIQPFHDFPEGPDWWSLDNVKAVLGQLPKLGLNFFGLHTYPEKGPNAEPTVWIGNRGEFDAEGKVNASYPASYQNTLRGNWGYEPKKTGEYSFGASSLFERDDYGNDVMEGFVPEPKPGPESNEVFNRAAAVFKDAFRFARGLGIKTCVGTETPLKVPELVRNRLAAKGKNPKDPAVVRDVYKAMFERIAAAYPVDYYWFWTWEGWTWSDAKAEEVKAVTSDLEQAIRAWKEVRPPFRLATCGWVLGPPSNRTLFDQVLPKDIAMSCINREVGKAPVDPTFARIRGRSLWAIPWLEDDPSLTSPQLWAGRMRRDAVDALRYGCDGLLGIHWRTRILSPNVQALARAAWDQSWNTLPKGPDEAAGPASGQFLAFKDRAIAGTKEPGVYQDVRDRVFGYRLPVPAGSYTVTLKFVEGQIDRKDGRVFDVFLQGKKVVEKFDIFARAGKFAALDLVFRDVAAKDGRISVDFIDRIHYPCIAGIVIESPNYVQRINCGGLAVAGYEPDWPETPRDLPTLDFYRDWALSEFGVSIGDEAAGLFNRIDGKLPIPVTWTDGPGGIVPNPRPWEEVRKDYEFVDDFAEIKTRLTGTATAERFDYWLKNFEYMREVTRFSCLWSDFNKAMDKVKAEKDPTAKARLAAAAALPVRVEMAGSLKKIFGCLLATAGTMGELGTIMNWEQHILPGAFEKPGLELEKILGEPLPAQAQLSSDYDGPPRIAVLSRRTSLEAGEDLRIKVGILSKAKPQKAHLYWREMGKGPYKAELLGYIDPFADAKPRLSRRGREARLRVNPEQTPAFMPGSRGVDRGVYTATLAAPATDIEYYIKITADGREVVWPTTAPALNQTVVIFKE